MQICTSILGVGVGERETGAAVVDIEFAAHALALGHDVQVILPHGRAACVAELPGVQVRPVGVLGAGTLHRLRRLWLVWRTMFQAFHENPRTVFRVNSFFSSLLEIAPLVVSKGSTLRLFIQFHHKDHNRWRNTVARFILRRAGLVICPSEAARRELVELIGCDTGTVRCIHHGVADRFFLPRSSATADAAAGKPLKLLFVGHLESRKNPHFLLHLARALHGSKAIELTIVGNGPELAQLRKRCDGQPWAESVRFAGEVSDAEKMALYAQADLFIFPSLQEGFGLVLCEAMAAGVPVMAFNTSAMPEIVRDGTGFLVAVNDVTAMANLVKDLAGDRKRLDTMRAQCIEHARRNFAWRSKVSEVLAALREAYPT